MDTLNSLLASLEVFAEAKGNSLSPHWADDLQDIAAQGTTADLAQVCIKTGWPMPVPFGDRPRPDQFPPAGAGL